MDSSRGILVKTSNSIRQSAIFCDNACLQCLPAIPTGNPSHVFYFGGSAKTVVSSIVGLRVSPRFRPQTRIRSALKTLSRGLPYRLGSPRCPVTELWHCVPGVLQPPLRHKASAFGCRSAAVCVCLLLTSGSVIRRALSAIADPSYQPAKPSNHSTERRRRRLIRSLDLARETLALRVRAFICHEHSERNIVFYLLSVPQSLHRIVPDIHSSTDMWYADDRSIVVPVQSKELPSQSRLLREKPWKNEHPKQCDLQKVFSVSLCARMGMHFVSNAVYEVTCYVTKGLGIAKPEHEK